MTIGMIGRGRVGANMTKRLLGRYPARTWEPREADRLLDRDGRTWRTR